MIGEKSKKKSILFLIITLSLVFYVLFNARNIILGPSIEIFTPNKDKIESKDNMLSIKGMVKNATYLSINERPIKIDREGVFEEKLLLSPSFNIIEIRAKDRFKNEIKKILEVYYRPKENPNNMNEKLN